jgi:hypothetical protein
VADWQSSPNGDRKGRILACKCDALRVGFDMGEGGNRSNLRQCGEHREDQIPVLAARDPIRISLTGGTKENRVSIQ